MHSVWVTALMVGVGGFVGTLARYGLTTLVQRQLPTGLAFPYGTLAVNLLGCFAIGAFAGLAAARQLGNDTLRAFVVVGLLGGFTTFSAFAYDTFALARSGSGLVAAANVLAQVGLGVALAGVGYLVMAR